MPRSDTLSIVIGVLQQLGVDVAEEQVMQVLAKTKAKAVKDVVVSEQASAITLTFSTEAFNELKKVLPNLPVMRVTQVGTRKRKE